MNCCNFKTGDEVDWKDASREAKQGRYWHGIVNGDVGVGKLGSDGEGHRILVRWTQGSLWTPFVRSRDGKKVVPDGSFQEVKLCTHLHHCMGLSPLHPDSLIGPS